MLQPPTDSVQDAMEAFASDAVLSAAVCRKGGLAAPTANDVVGLQLLCGRPATTPFSMVAANQKPLGKNVWTST